MSPGTHQVTLDLIYKEMELIHYSLCRKIELSICAECCLSLDCQNLFSNSKQCLTLSGVSKLPTCHSSISTAPSIITHSTPHIFYTNLHSPFIWNITSNQSQRASCAWSCIDDELLQHLHINGIIIKIVTFTPHTSISRVSTVMCQDWSTRTLQ